MTTYTILDTKTGHAHARGLKEEDARAWLVNNLLERDQAEEEPGSDLLVFRSRPLMMAPDEWAGRLIEAVQRGDDINAAIRSIGKAFRTSSEM